MPCQSNVLSPFDKAIPVAQSLGASASNSGVPVLICRPKIPGTGDVSLKLFVRQASTPHSEHGGGKDFIAGIGVDIGVSHSNSHTLPTKVVCKTVNCVHVHRI